MKKISMFIFASLAILSSIAAQAQTLGELQSAAPKVAWADGKGDLYRHRHALIIGISTYQSSQIPALSFAHKDAEAMRSILRDSFGFTDITLLLNQQATKKAIEDALANLSDEAKVAPEDCVVVYFSGHGQAVTGGQSGSLGYFIPYDADVDLNAVQDRSRYGKSCISMPRIREALDQSAARHTALIADTCYSGLFTDKALPLTPVMSDSTIARYLGEPARFTLTAGAKSDLVKEDKGFQQGVFTYFLLQQMQEATRRKAIVSLRELFNPLPTLVSNRVGATQNPVIESNDTSGEFLLIPSGAIVSQELITRIEAMRREIPPNVEAKPTPFKRDVNQILDAAIKAHGGPAFLDVRSFKITGDVTINSLGADASGMNPSTMKINNFTLYLTPPDKMRVEAEVLAEGEKQRSITVVNGKKAFTKSGDEEAEEIKPNIIFPFCDPLAGLRAAILDKKAIHPLDGADNGLGFVVADSSGSEMNLYFDEETHRLNRLTASPPFVTGETKLVIRFLDYKEVGGLWMPHRLLMNSRGAFYEKTEGNTTYSSNPNVSIDVSYTNFIFNPKLDETKLFADLK